MVKKLSLCMMVCFCLLLIGNSASARPPGATESSLFVGATSGYSFPKVFRFNFKGVELGTYPTSVGLTKVFQSGTYYSHFGLGFSRQGKTEPGFIAGVGYHNVWGIFGFKFDWSTFGGLAGYMNTDLSIGVTLNF